MCDILITLTTYCHPNTEFTISVVFVPGLTCFIYKMMLILQVLLVQTQTMNTIHTTEHMIFHRQTGDYPLLPHSNGVGQSLHLLMHI